MKGNMKGNMEVTAEGSTEQQQQPLGLGISDYGEQRQASTVRSDTPVPSQSPDMAPSSTSSVKAATPTPQADSEKKHPINTYSVAATVPSTPQAGSQRKTRSQPPSVNKAATPTPEVDTPKTTTNGNSNSIEIDSVMSTRNLRKRKDPPTSMFDPATEAMKPLTDEERHNWKGWVELESDPVSA